MHRLNQNLKEATVIKGFNFSQEEIKQSLKNKSILQVGIGTTGLCNYSCLYCFAEAGKALQSELSNNKIKKALKMLQRWVPKLGILQKVVSH